MISTILLFITLHGPAYHAHNLSAASIANEAIFGDETSPSIRLDPVPKGDIDALIGDEDYPSYLIEKGIEGVSSFRLTVDTSGRALHCSITGSSGSSDLDDITCKLMQKRARFDPATDREGKPILASYSHKKIWKLPTKNLK